MNNNLKVISQVFPKLPSASHTNQQKLLKPFWLAVTLLILLEIFTVRTESIASIIGFILIAFAALLPTYLWCSGRALGMPIFPIFALPYLWTHALPLVSNYPKIMAYSPEQHLFTSLTTAGSLLIGTMVWFSFVKSSPPIPKQYRTLSSKESNGLFLILLLIGSLFYISSASGWLTLDGPTFSLCRNLILAINILSIFVLSYRFGTRELSKDSSNLFLIFLALYMLSSTVSLLLIDALSMMLLSTIAFVIGRHKIPWLPVILVLLCLSFLQQGKTEMRAKYWADSQSHAVEPWEYSAWYGEWIDDSIKSINSKNDKQKIEKKESIAERSSVIQMLLLTQSLTPKRIPYLSGATYSIIPQLLVPRIFNKDKIRSHEGTYMLSIIYGLQNRHATLTTTIGWGLLSEAYANFGLLGCAGLAVILGAAYGQAARWSLNTPLLSDRSLLCAILMSFSFQTEWTAGVYVAALFQYLVPWGMISFFLMSVHRNPDSEMMFIPYGQDIR